MLRRCHDRSEFARQPLPCTPPGQFVYLRDGDQLLANDTSEFSSDVAVQGQINLVC